MLLRRGEFVFLAAVLVGAYGVDRGITALVAATCAYYAARWATRRDGRARERRRRTTTNDDDDDDDDATDGRRWCCAT